MIRKLLLRPIDWLTLSPFVVGATLGLGTWAVDAQSGMAQAASAVLILAAAGVYVNRLIFGWSANYERIVAEWREMREKTRDAELDRLYVDLRKDGDPRTATLLKDLRTLTKALRTEQPGSVAMDACDIVADVDKLFQRSVDYLRESLELWRTAAAMERKSIKDQLLRQRELLIVEVEKSLENLGTVLGSMKKASVDSADGQQLSELRAELSARLRVAEEVEDRMKAMRRDPSSVHDEQTYLKHAE